MTQPDTAAPAAAADPALRERLVDTIRALLPGVLERELPEISEQTELIAAFEVTSVAALELILRLETRLELEVSVEDLEREDFATVGSLADYIAANLLDEE